MKIFNLLLCSAAVSAVTTACDENLIGNSIIETESHLIVDSAYTISGESVAASKIRSRTISQLLGRLYAEEYGSLQSDFVTEFMPVNEIDTAGVTVNDIDSIKLHFLMPMGSYTGDSITPMRVSVYQLNKNLPYPIYSDFDPSNYYSKDNILGATTYTMTMLGQSDSLRTYDTSTGSYIYYRAVDIKLPRQLGQSFYNEYLTNPASYQDPEAFKQFFPGIYATTTYGDGRVINISGTQINLYYKKKTVNDEGNDTIINQIGQYYGVSPEIVTNNNIRLQPSEHIKSIISSGDVVIQTPAGYEAKISLPVSKLLDKYYELCESGQTVLNQITFTVPAKKITNGKKIEAPKYLLFVKASEKDKFFDDKKVTDGTNAIYAEYNDSKEAYTFYIREYVKQFIDENKEATTDDETISLVPVDITFEESQNSYYQTESKVLTVTPQVSAPTMARMDIRKAKIVATFSKKDFQ
ncbi:MAG: DUF4270 domain-containing protein [Bacteroidetes bacterium]|uniref:DUF4270 domain-containing protein n=1 Tax=Candidatus Limisoma faecipullorum TaxID=2840854 RepID=A0A9D9IQS9_9BACT|nr:DUF4270 domain-containing protein [Candidatus Limisoma faecipullorum]